jgi:hypothetical protein
LPWPRIAAHRNPTSRQRRLAAISLSLQLLLSSLLLLPPSLQLLSLVLLL